MRAVGDEQTTEKVGHGSQRRPLGLKPTQFAIAYAALKRRSSTIKAEFFFAGPMERM